MQNGTLDGALRGVVTPGGGSPPSLPCHQRMHIVAACADALSYLQSHSPQVCPPPCYFCLLADGTCMACIVVHNSHHLSIAEDTACATHVPFDHCVCPSLKLNVSFAGHLPLSSVTDISHCAKRMSWRADTCYTASVAAIVMSKCSLQSCLLCLVHATTIAVSPSTANLPTLLQCSSAQTLAWLWPNDARPLVILRLCQQCM